MKITLELLEKLDACDDQLKMFEHLFPDGVTPTLQLAEKHIQDFDWSWAGRNLLRGKGKRRFIEGLCLFRNDYCTFVQATRETFTDAFPECFGKHRNYTLEEDKLRRAYQAIVRHAARVPALQRARLFIRLFKKYHIKEEESE